MHSGYPRLKLFVAALVLCPAAPGQSFRAAWQRALALQQSGDFAGAGAAYRECLNIDPSRYGAQSNFGAVLAALGRTWTSEWRRNLTPPFEEQSSCCCLLSDPPFYFHRRQDLYNRLQ